MITTSVCIYVFAIVLSMDIKEVNSRGAAVRVGGQSGGGRKARPGEEIDYGMPVTHPAVMLPIIGLIIMGSVAIITCCCKCFPERVPDNLKVFGKRSAEENLQLQLGRRTGRNRRRTSELSQVSANPKSNGRSRSISKTPSFNSNSNRRPDQYSTTNETVPTTTIQVQNPQLPHPTAPKLSPLELPYSLSPSITLKTVDTPPPPYSAVVV